MKKVILLSVLLFLALAGDSCSSLDMSCRRKERLKQKEIDRTKLIEARADCPHGRARETN